MKLYLGQYIGETGIYKQKEYPILIGMKGSQIYIRRKCGAGERWYPSIIEFLNDWDNLRKA